jgi:hypothetical protein
MKIIVGKYEGTIYPEGNGYTGAIDIGTGASRQRLKRKGRTWVSPLSVEGSS